MPTLTLHHTLQVPQRLGGPLTAGIATSWTPCVPTARSVKMTLTLFLTVTLKTGFHQVIQFVQNAQSVTSIITGFIYQIVAKDPTPCVEPVAHVDMVTMWFLIAQSSLTLCVRLAARARMENSMLLHAVWGFTTPTRRTLVVQQR